MRNRPFLLFVLAALAIVALWWFFVYSPAGDELDEAKADREAEESQTAGLQAQLAQLEEIARNEPEIDAQLMQYEALIPPTPDLASFILSANEIAEASGIDWQSITPSEPQADPNTGTGTIDMQISIEGGFFQALDYLNRLEDLQRLVVVDSLSMSAGAADTGGAPSLSISVVGRMFTQATPAAPGVPTTPGGGTSGTTTTSVAEVTP